MPRFGLGLAECGADPAADGVVLGDKARGVDLEEYRDAVAGVAAGYPASPRGAAT